MQGASVLKLRCPQLTCLRFVEPLVTTFTEMEFSAM